MLLVLMSTPLRKYLKLNVLNLSRGYTMDKLMITLIFIFLSVFSEERTIVYSIPFVFVVFLNFYKVPDPKWKRMFYSRNTLRFINSMEFFFINVLIFLLLFYRELDLFYCSAVLGLNFLLKIFHEKLRKIIHFRSFHYLPTTFYELKSFLRSVHYSLFLTVGSGVLITQHFMFFLFFTLFIIDMFSNIFSTNENKEIFTGFFKLYSLKYKIMIYCVFHSTFFSLAILLAAYFQERFLLFSFYGFVYTMLYLILIITYKHSNYKGYKARKPLSITESLSFLFLSLSVIFALIEISSLYKKSILNINKYVGG
ncbi:MAG: hypothetical protein RL207_1624 [Bacteroidota bacterium]|jgi:hypothetical protein